MSIRKCMTWTEMQEHPIVTDSTAFHDLTHTELLEVFDLVDYSCENQVIKTVVCIEDNLITIEMYNFCCKHPATFRGSVCSECNQYVE